MWIYKDKGMRFHRRHHSLPRKEAKIFDRERYSAIDAARSAHPGMWIYKDKARFHRRHHSLPRKEAKIFDRERYSAIDAARSAHPGMWIYKDKSMRFKEMAKPVKHV
jgi:hypothetical protein